MLGGGFHKAELQALEQRVWLLQPKRNRVLEGAHLGTLRAVTIAVNPGPLLGPSGLRLAPKGRGNSSGNKSVPPAPSALQRPLLVEHNIAPALRAEWHLLSPAPGPHSRTEKGGLGAERK